MSISNSDLMRKIEKLLAHVNNNANVNEAAVAASMVQKLMMDYNISEQEIAEQAGNSAPSPVGFEKYNYSSQKSRVAWQNSLLNIVAKYTFCKTVYTPKTPLVTLIGEDANRAATKAIYEYLRDEVLRLENIAWNNYIASTYNPEHHRGYWNQFCTGATVTINSRMKEERAAEQAQNNKATGLIVVKDKLVTKKMAELFPQGTSTTRAYCPAGSAYTSGVIAGRNIPLRPGALQIA